MFCFVYRSLRFEGEISGLVDLPAATAVANTKWRTHIRLVVAVLVMNSKFSFAIGIAGARPIGTWIAREVPEQQSE
jgi:hypothetical protein